MLSGRRAAVVVVAVVAAVGGLAAARSVTANDPVPAEASTTAGGTASTRETLPLDPAQEAFDETVAELQAFVEDQRDLKFLRPVEARLLDDARFAEMIATDDGTGDPPVEELRRTERILKALALITPDFDLVGMVTDPARRGQDVLGVYSDETEVLYVRGTSLTPMVKSVLVHELVHALDDQHFDLSKYSNLTGELEDNLAARALVEGNARRIENLYVEQLSAVDAASVEAARDARPESDAVDEFQIADYFAVFPYLDGAEFVTAIAGRGGERAVDDAFRRPPRTTAEVLEPMRYMSGIRGTLLTPPDSPSPVVDTGMFGELGLFLLLLDAVGPVNASIAASTWEGDSYVAYEDGDRMCARVRFLLEGVREGEVTAEILTAWAEQQSDATIDSRGTLIVTTCR